MSEPWLYDWVIWASLGAGLGVTGLVFALGVRFPVGRRRRKSGMREEELPWEELLGLLKERYRGKSAADETLSSDELIDLLLADLPNTLAPEGVDWRPAGDRRRARRRWANPVEVTVISPFHDKPIQGLVINRSVGGMAILTDVEFAPDTILAVRPVEAPEGVGYADVCVRHSRLASRLWIVGCQYKNELPWNVKVWFG
jgi:hypothetical protein